MDQYFEEIIEDLKRDVSRWLLHGRRMRHVKASEEELKEFRSLQSETPEIFNNYPEIIEYLDLAEYQYVKQTLILSIKGGHVTAAVNAYKKGARLNLDDRGDEWYQLKAPFYAAVTGDDRTDENILSPSDETSQLDDQKSIFDDPINLNITTSRGLTALNWAAVFGNFDLVKKLIKKGADIKKINDDGSSVLFDAAYGGSLEVVTYLHQQGLEINHSSLDKNTALLWATQQNHELVRDYLIENGATPEFETKDGWNTLTEIVRAGRLDWLVEYLKNKSNSKDIVNHKVIDDISPLHVACQSDKSESVEIARLLIDKAAEFDAKTKRDGISPLHFAAANGNIKMIEFLIDHLEKNNRKADVDIKDHYGSTPLFYAIDNNLYSVVSYLVKKGCDVNVQNNYGMTPLIAAAQKGYARIVKYLLENKADPNVWDREMQWNALHYAANEGDAYVTDYLLSDGGIDINEIVPPGWTSLMLAASKGRIPIIEKLLQKNADVEFTNMLGQDALKVAHDHSQRNTVALLKQWAINHPEMTESLVRQLDRENVISRSDDGSFSISDDRLRVSDEVTFLQFEDLSDLEKSEVEEFIQKSNVHIDVRKEKRKFRKAILPFYKTFCLLTIEDISKKQGHREQFALYAPKINLLVLDWSNEGIYQVNEKEAENFDISSDTNAISYCRFFFHFVRGQLGCFQFLEPDDASFIPWTENAAEQDKAAAKQQLKPLKVVDRTAKGRIILEGTCLFKDALFSTKILVATQKTQIKDAKTGVDEQFTVGQLKLFEEELIMENLSVAVDKKRNTIFG